MTAQATEGRSDADWAQVLERIEESLAQTLRLAPDPLAHSSPARADSNPLAKLDERQALWQARLDEGHNVENRRSYRRTRLPNGAASDTRQSRGNYYVRSPS